MRSSSLDRSEQNIKLFLPHKQFHSPFDLTERNENSPLLDDLQTPTNENMHLFEENLTNNNMEFNVNKNYALFQLPSP